MSVRFTLFFCWPADASGDETTLFLVLGCTVVVTGFVIGKGRVVLFCSELV